MSCRFAPKGYFRDSSAPPASAAEASCNRFCGATVTGDALLLAYRELEHARNLFGIVADFSWDGLARLSRHHVF
jgi:hypothetical protein